MEQILIDIASKGTGWALALYLFKKYIEEKDKRLADAKESRKLIVEPLEGFQTTLNAIVQILQSAGRRKR